MIYTHSLNVFPKVFLHNKQMEILEKEISCEFAFHLALSRMLNKFQNTTAELLNKKQISDTTTRCTGFSLLIDEANGGLVSRELSHLAVT